ncbi:transmembrane protein 147 [Thrips palmi]|uniref:BOS complex subunit TMEM147 n=1 Tax=Thrips palmi TaxID=161013 RepID=A0A6P8Z005_THRPL|nr:transmembrane protein 147 [Thrips palmi]
MTLYHFGNCVALVYVPYYLTYKFSGLGEYGAFWKCIQAGFIYAFTQLVKMLILATFFPTSEGPGVAGIDLFTEFFKATVDLLDLVGMYLILSGIPGKGHAKIVTAGVGWGGAELLLTRGLLLWVGARGSEFHWKYIQKCLESNISLVQHVKTAALVWMWTRHDLKKSFVPIVTVLLLATIYKPLVMEYVVEVMAIGAWSALSLKAAVTILFGVITLQMYVVLAESIGMF